MADFFNRLVSRTLSGLEPTVKPVIAPMYASGVTMTDNYAMDTSPEWDLSGSTEYDSDESPMEQSQELLGISATETLNSPSNVSLINFGEILSGDNSSEITASEQIESDSAIAPEATTKDSLSEPSSPSIASSTTIQKSTSADTVEVNPTIQPQDNFSEITSGEQIESDSAIAPEATSDNNLSTESLSTIVPQSSSRDRVKETPTIQPQDDLAEITSSEQIEADSAIAAEATSKDSLSEPSSPPITPSTTIQKSTSTDTVKVNPTIQPQDNFSQITSSEQIELDSAIAPEVVTNDSSSEPSSPPINPSIASSRIVQKSTSADTVKVTPIIQLQDNFSQITSSEQIESDSAIAPEVTNNNNLSEPSSPPINPSIASSTTVQKSSSADTVKINPTIQPQDNFSQITSSEQIEADSAIAPEATSRDSLSESSSPPINPLIASSTTIQKSTSPDTVKVTPTIQPQNNLAEITSSEQIESDGAIASEATSRDSLSESSSPPVNPLIASSTTIQKSSSPDTVKVNPTIQPQENFSEITASEQIESDSASALSPLNSKLNSQSLSNQSGERENAIAEDNSLLQLNNQSSPERSSKVSLPLVKSEVIAPLSSSPPNSPEQIQPPVNRVKLIPSIESDLALESNIPATSNSLTPSSPSPEPSMQSRAAQVMRSPIADETGSQSSDLLQNQTREIKPQSNFVENNPLMSSSDKPDPSLLRITNQFNSIKQEVITQQISANQGEIMTSNRNNHHNSRNNISLPTDTVIYRPSLDKSLARIDPISAQIKPRLEITSQEIAQTPEQSSYFANSSSSPPSSSQLSPTGRRETMGSNQISGMIATAESTPTINITIGQVEVRGIKPPEPPPIKKSRAKTPQLSLSDYLDQRGGK